MKQLSVAAILFAVFLLVSIPVYADEAQDYIQAEISEWTTIAADNGFKLLGTYASRVVGSNNVTYTLDLAPGTYHLYASGGMYVEDLDIYVNSEDGTELAGDTESDKIPILVFELEERSVVDVVVAPWSFKEGYNADYFCVLLTCNDDGEIFSFMGQVIEQFTDNPDEMYRMEINSSFAHWVQLEEDQGHEPVAHDVILVDTETETMKFDLDAGFYSVYAQPDSRCPDLDIKVYDEDLNVIAEDTYGDNIPVCEFVVLEDMEITVELQVYSLVEGEKETYVGYMLSWVSGLERSDRINFIEDKLASLEDQYVYEGVTVFEKGYYEISEFDAVFHFDIELEPGWYYSEAQGGMAVLDLDMAVYEEAGNLLGDDTYEDNYPIVSFEIIELQTVSFEVIAKTFADGFDEDYFAWIITDSEEISYDDYYDDYTYNSYSDEEMLESLNAASAFWQNLIDAHGDQVVEMLSPLIEQGVNDNKWSTDYTFTEGTWFIYGQGDDMCIWDLDLSATSESEGMVTDELGNNNPYLILNVGPDGATYTINALAFNLECEKGFFRLWITRPDERIKDPVAFIENEVTEWTATAENQGLNVLGEYVGTIYAGFEDDVIGPGYENWSLDLAPGHYYLFSSGGRNCEDLDLTVTDAAGKPLGSDTNPDNIPVVQIVVTERGVVNLEFMACTWISAAEDGLFCLVVASKGDGEIFNFEGSEAG